MSERTEKLKTAIETLHHCTAHHLDSTPVFEAFQGKVIWEGVVDTFEIIGHPKTFRCYAWPFKSDAGEELSATVLGIPPVASPETAVKVAIASGQISLV
ncbi:MAG: hypothetical protein ABJF10_07625 [Chthoniobacter sp.]|uniref:hypothetical protein n=1 Tax=Chthoniobacter sp. TaxID=2510640 RepID=UPI0032AB383D